jgi:hypothetical protein
VRFCVIVSGSVTLGEEHGLRVLENRVLRNVLEHKGDKATGDWRRLHNEELYDLYSSPNIIKKNEMGGTCCTFWDGRVEYRGLVGKPEGRRKH